MFLLYSKTKHSCLWDSQTPFRQASSRLLSPSQSPLSFSMPFYPSLYLLCKCVNFASGKDSALPEQRFLSSRTPTTTISHLDPHTNTVKPSVMLPPVWTILPGFGFYHLCSASGNCHCEENWGNHVNHPICPLVVMFCSVYCLFVSCEVKYSLSDSMQVLIQLTVSHFNINSLQ